MIRGVLQTKLERLNQQEPPLEPVSSPAEDMTQRSMNRSTHTND
jgi:hypothetical protein